MHHLLRAVSSDGGAPFHSTTSSMLCPVSGKTTTLHQSRAFTGTVFGTENVLYSPSGEERSACRSFSLPWLRLAHILLLHQYTDWIRSSGSLEKTLALPCFHFYVAVAQSTADACVIFCSCYASKMDPAKPIFVVKNLIG